MATSARGEARRQRAMQLRRVRSSAEAVPVLYEGTIRREAITAEAQPLLDYVGSPYDPTYVIRVAPFITKGILDAASSEGWRRTGAAAIFVVTLLGCLGAVTLTISTLSQRNGFWLVNAIWSALFAFLFGALVLALGRRFWAARGEA